MNVNPSELLNADIVFVLEIDWNGDVHRFSSIPIVVPSDDGSISYVGRMNEPNIQNQTSIVGFNPDGDSVPIQIIFEYLDLVEQYWNGRKLDGARCEISMYTVRNGVVVQTYENRIPLYLGEINQPIIGDPDQPLGYVTFSIENSLNTKRRKLLNTNSKIGLLDFPDQHVESCEGKILPFVFGDASNYPVVKSGNVVGSGSGAISPAYLVKKASGAGIDIILAFANHPVDGANVTIHDFKGNVETIATDTENRISDGSLFGVVDLSGTSIAHDGTAGVATDDFYYWVEYGDGGGFPNPYGDGSLSGGGDVCRYMLELSDLEIDWSAWNGIAGILNRYRFAGYVNDPTVDAFDWMLENIVQFLPIEIINGERGIRPVLSLYHYANNFNPLFDFVEGDDMEIVSPMIPLRDSSEIVNDLTMSFGWSGQSETFRTRMKISERGDGRLSISDSIAQTSIDRFGRREQSIESYFVYDMNTATKILRDQIRIKALNAIGIEMDVHPRFGFVRVGDVVTLTSERLKMTSIIGQIVAKRWNGGRWRYILSIEENIFINPRTD